MKNMKIVLLSFNLVRGNDVTEKILIFSYFDRELYFKIETLGM